ARAHGAHVPRVPNTSNLHLPGLRADATVIALDLEGIAVSAGAACSSGTQRRSPSLVAMGLPEEADASIRVSLSPETTEEEIDRLLAAVSLILERAGAPVFVNHRGAS